VAGVDHILEVLTDRLRVPEVMVRFDESVEEFLLSGAPDLLESQRPELAKPNAKRCCLDIDSLWHSVLSGVIGWPIAYRWKLNEARAIEFEHEAATNHVAKLTVRLTPIPGFTQELRKSSAARFGMLGDEFADELEVALGDRAAAILQLHFHGGEA
jgi:hypothetical protein